jgi:hypothetical protein
MTVEAEKFAVGIEDATGAAKIGFVVIHGPKEQTHEQ